MPRLPSSVRRRTREFFVPDVGFRLSAQRFPRYVTTGILIITLLVLTGSLPGFRNDARATSLSPGFVLETVISGLDNPTAVAFSPDGRTFIVERDGLVKVFSGPDTTVSTYIDLRAAANETKRAPHSEIQLASRSIRSFPQFPSCSSHSRACSPQAANLVPNAPSMARFCK